MLRGCLCFSLALSLILLGATTQARSSPLKNQVRLPLHKTARTGTHFVIAMRQKNLDQLENLFWQISEPSSAMYRQHLTRDEISSLTGASADDVTQIVHWLADLGASHVEPLVGRDFIRATFPDQKEIEIIPTELSDLVTHVIAIADHTKKAQPKNYSSYHNALINSKRSATAEPQWTPKAQKTLYGVPQNLVASNSSNAQMVWGTGTYGITTEDLSQFYQKFEVPQNMSLVVQQGFKGVPGGDNFFEATLDTEYITGMGPGVRTFVYNSNNSASTEAGLGFGPAMVDFIVALANETSPPLVVSMSLGSLSWASCDVMCKAAMKLNSSLTYDQCIDYSASNFQVCMFDASVEMSLMNTEFMKLGAMGVSLIAASGDGGTHFSFGPFPNDPLGKTLNSVSCANTMPTFPCTSGLITAAGGMMTASTSKNQTVHPIGCDSSLGCDVTGGGAFSWLFPLPSYQSAVVSKYLSLPQNQNLGFAFNGSNRGYPDVATIATNVPIIAQGSVSPAGGTSAAAPEFAGMISLINDALLNAKQKPLGFLNPALYALAAQSNANAFYDITEGSTRCGASGSCCKDGFAASEGWDAMSGLGMPFFEPLLKYLGPKQELVKALRKGL